MATYLKTAVLAAFAALSTTAGFAQNNTIGAGTVATMSCTRTGGGSPITFPLNAFTFDTSSAGGTFYLTIYTDPALVNLLLVEEYFGGKYSTCVFSPNIGTSVGLVSIVNVSIAAAAPGVAGTTAQAYASATFAANSLSIGVEAITAKAISAEDQAKALAAHQAKGLALPKAN